MNSLRERLSEYFMYFIIIIWFSSEVLLNSKLEYILWWEAKDVNGFMGYFCLVLLIFQIVFLQHYQTKEIFILMFISIPIVLGTINSNYNIMLSTWLFIMASKYVDFEKVAWISYFVLIIMMLIVFYLFFTGWINETTVFRGSLLRHSWGFNHPNWLGVRVFQLVLIHCYIRRHKMMVFDYLIVLLAAWFVNRIPNCKTAYYSLIILIIALIIGKTMEYIQGGAEFFAKVLILIAAASNVVSVVLSLISVKGYPILDAVDKFMSRRFSWCYRTFKYYGLSLFGKDIELHVRRMNTLVRRFFLDTAYMSILLRYGIIVYLCFSLLYIFTMKYLLRTKSYFLILVLSIYAIYGIMENTFFSMTQNIFLIVLTLPIYGKENVDESKYVSDKKVRFRIVL